MQPYRRLPLKTIFNCRDLGGYPYAGGVTKFGRLLRCGIPGSVCQEDIDTLHAYGVRAVLDLRGDYEVAQQPSTFAAHPEFVYRHASLYEFNPATDADESSTLWDVYAGSVAEYKDNYATVLRTLIENPVPTVYHCFLGKDRTGILSSLLLSAAGVALADIVADYQVSLVYLLSFYEQYGSKEDSSVWETKREHLLSEAKTMQCLLAHFEKQYGGVNGYFAEIGLSQAEITAVGALLK